MRKHFLLFPLLIAILFAGCIFDSNNNDNTGDGNGALSAVDFFPLTINAYWTRTASEVAPDGTIASDITTDTITGATEYSGTTYYITEDLDGNLGYYRIGDNTIYSYVRESDLLGQSNGSTGEDHLDLPVADFDTEKGGTWDIGSGRINYADGFIDWTMTGAFEGTENTSVPAGDFTGCAVFSTTLAMTTDRGGESGTHTTTTTLWFARDVGLVRESAVEEENNAVLLTTTTVLDAYDVSGEAGDTYLISGKLLDESGNGITDATVTLSRGNTYVTTSTGLFIFTGIPPGTYTITPYREGYTFTPEIRQVIVSDGNMTGQNFSGEFTGAGEFQARKYYPLVVGSYYSYGVLATFGDGSSEMDQVTDAVTSATAHGGISSYIVESTITGTDELVKSCNVRVTDNIVYQYFTVDTLLDALLSPTGEGGSLSDIPELPFLNFNVSAGESWELYAGQDILGELLRETTIIGTFLGFEDVSAEAGDFDACAKFAVITEVDFTQSAGDPAATVTLSLATILWLAPEVGTVMRQDTVVINGVLAITLFYNLLDYQIPSAKQAP